MSDMIPVMRKVAVCLVLATLTATAQTVNQPFDRVNPHPSQAQPSSVPVAQTITRMRSILMAMKSQTSPGDTLNRQLADNMRALAQPERQLSSAEVIAFTTQLANTIRGTRTIDQQDTILLQCLVDAMRPRTQTNFQLAKRLRDSLTALGANGPRVDSAIRSFVAVAEAVHGPDDQSLRSN